MPLQRVITIPRWTLTETDGEGNVVFNMEFPAHPASEALLNVSFNVDCPNSVLADLQLELADPTALNVKTNPAQRVIDVPLPNKPHNTESAVSRIVYTLKASAVVVDWEWLLRYANPTGAQGEPRFFVHARSAVSYSFTAQRYLRQYDANDKVWGQETAEANPTSFERTKSGPWTDDAESAKFAGLCTMMVTRQQIPNVGWTPRGGNSIKIWPK